MVRPVTPAALQGCSVCKRTCYVAVMCEQLSINVADVLDAGFKSSRDMEDDLAAVKSALVSIVHVRLGLSCCTSYRACVLCAEGGGRGSLIRVRRLRVMAGTGARSCVYSVVWTRRAS